MEKLTQEEEKKLIGLVAFASEINDLTTSSEEINNIKEKLVLRLKENIVSMADTRRNIIEIENEINENINNEELNDLYLSDPVTISMVQYIRLTKSYDLNKEQAIKAMYECIVELIEMINEGMLKPIKRTEFVDEELLSDEEINALKNKALRWVMFWKKTDKTSARKQIEYQMWKEALGSKQKFSIFNDMFFEHTGEYVLDRIKKEKDKKDDTEREADNSNRQPA